MRAIPFLFAFLLVFCVTLPTWSQDGTSATQKVVKKKNANPKNKPSEMSAERKAQILAFVSEHHPELTELLNKLEKGKKKRPWLNAMRGLDRTIKKLEGIKADKPERYDSALKQWNLESRIRVASAQLKHSDTEEGRAKLEALVSKHVDFHINRLKNDRQNILKRLEQMEKRISEAESNRQQQIEKKLKSVLPKAKKEKKDKEKGA